MSTTSTAITHSPHSRTRTVAGWVCSSLVVLFLLFDAVIKLPPIQPVTDTLRQLGFVPTPTLARGLGVMLLAITALYVWPRTARVGALLLAAYLGARSRCSCVRARRSSATCCSAYTWVCSQ